MGSTGLLVFFIPFVFLHPQPSRYSQPPPPHSRSGRKRGLWQQRGTGGGAGQWPGVSQVFLYLSASLPPRHSRDKQSLSTTGQRLGDSARGEARRMSGCKRAKLHGLSEFETGSPNAWSLIGGRKAGQPGGFARREGDQQVDHPHLRFFLRCFATLVVWFRCAC